MDISKTSKHEYKSIRFAAPEGFRLNRRANRDKLPIDANPEAYTLEQLMVNDTIRRYNLSRVEIAAIMNISMSKLQRFLLPPVNANHSAMPPNFPMLLEAWCKANRK